MAETKKLIDINLLRLYDTKLKEHIETEVGDLRENTTASAASAASSALRAEESAQQAQEDLAAIREDLQHTVVRIDTFEVNMEDGCVYQDRHENAQQSFNIDDNGNLIMQLN